MKRSVLGFVIPVCLSLLIVPTSHIVWADRDDIKWDKAFLFNMDFAARWAARVMYPFGISIEPKRVVIGRDGWLFLGDRFATNLSIDRRLASASDFEQGKRIGAATAAWNIYLSGKGVKLFKIMVGPNKGTIYPEYLPNWARPADPNAMDALLAGAGSAHYIDLRPALRAAKSRQSAPLYFQTDTHWNALGAGVAFRAFAEHSAASIPELRWPTASVYRLKEVQTMGGGDLAAFLRLKAHLSDVAPVIEAASLPITALHQDFETKEVLLRDTNPAIGMTHKPMLVKTQGALNQKKVLWLGDSFSGAMSQLMAATFSELLVQHVANGLETPAHFARLVDDFKPDYVFITVVERSSRAPAFAAYPPPLVLHQPVGFTPLQDTVARETHHLVPGHSSDEYRIQGDDPFVEFDLVRAMNPIPANALQIQLTCEDGTATLPVQLFWLRDGQPGYERSQSAQMELTAGQNLIDMRTVAGWGGTPSIHRIRLDVDTKSRCERFRLETPTLGLRQVS